MISEPETLQAPPITGGYCTIELNPADDNRWYYGYRIRLPAVPGNIMRWTHSGVARLPDLGPESTRTAAIHCAAACIRTVLPSLGFESRQHLTAKTAILAWLEQIAPEQTDMFAESDDERA